jgi:hypothetical protein
VPGRQALGSEALAVGGLAQLLRAISEHFRLTNPQPSQLLNVPTWELTGLWKGLEPIQAGQTPDNTQLPAHLPTHVKLILGRDQQFPLFPYRIEFGRAQPDSETKGGAASVQPMVTMELYEVRRRNDLPADLFRYSPGDQDVEDQTDLYLGQLHWLGQK